jgi:hypothetical protein
MIILAIVAYIVLVILVIAFNRAASLLSGDEDNL